MMACIWRLPMTLALLLTLQTIGCSSHTDGSGAGTPLSTGTPSRARRQTSDNDRYEVEISFPAQSGPVTNEDTKQEEDVEKLIEDIILKQGEFDVDAQLPHVKSDPTSLQLEQEFVCRDGKVLVDRWCVECAVGTRFDKETRTCRKCPIGQYQSRAGQVNCTVCPLIGGKPGTTALRGSQTPDLCKERCSAGHFFDSAKQKCRPCGVGFYQDRSGQFSCLPCEPGLTTRDDRSTSRRMCTAACPAGQQLSESNACEPCARGTYRAGESAAQTCAACPNGTTTGAAGATGPQLCLLPVCPPGTFLNGTEAARCAPCPFATYQPESLQDACLPCPEGTTTAQEGSVRASECVDPCAGADAAGLCHPSATCLVTSGAASFRCQCKLGFTGDGRNCTDRCAGFCENGGQCRTDSRSGEPSCDCAGSFTGERCTEKSQFAYIVGGVAGFVVLVVICLLIVWMICARSNRRKNADANKALTLAPDAASQMNVYYGAPTPYAESIAPSHHSNYAHYYDEEDDAWEMPSYYNDAFVRDGGRAGTLPRSGTPSMYGTTASNPEELYDRLRKHAYTGKVEADSPDAQQDQQL